MLQQVLNVCREIAMIENMLRVSYFGEIHQNIQSEDLLTVRWVLYMLKY